MDISLPSKAEFDLFRANNLEQRPRPWVSGQVTEETADAPLGPA